MGSLGLLAGPPLALRVLERVDLASLQDRVSAIVALFLPGLALLVAAVVVPTVRTGSTAVLGAAIVGAGLATAGAIAVAHAAERAHVERVVAESEVVAHLPGRYAYLWQRHRRGLALAGPFLVALYAWVLWQLRGQVMLWFGLLGGLAAVAPLFRNRELTITDVGLVDGVSVHDWDRYERFEVTDDALVLHEHGLGSKTRFPLDRIEDLDAVVEALERHLDRATE